MFENRLSSSETALSDDQNWLLERFDPPRNCRRAPSSGKQVVHKAQAEHPDRKFRWKGWMKYAKNIRCYHRPNLECLWL